MVKSFERCRTSESAELGNNEPVEATGGKLFTPLGQANVNADQSGCPIRYHISNDVQQIWSIRTEARIRQYGSGLVMASHRKELRFLHTFERGCILQMRQDSLKFPLNEQFEVVVSGEARILRRWQDPESRGKTKAD